VGLVGDNWTKGVLPPNFDPGLTCAQGGVTLRPEQGEPGGRISVILARSSDHNEQASDEALRLEMRGLTEIQKAQADERKQTQQCDVLFAHLPVASPFVVVLLHFSCPAGLWFQATLVYNFACARSATFCRKTPAFGFSSCVSQPVWISSPS
jgi:hypothetical protein